MERFIIQKSDNEINHYVVTDQINKIVVVFENGKFNDTQKVQPLEDINPASFMQLAKIMRELGEWLYINHKDKI